MSAKQLVPLGLFAGFVDSTGGGGWGPITTPVLLARGNEARKVIGSVDTSEFPVSLRNNRLLHLTWLGTSKLGLGIFSHARWYRSGTNRGMASSHRSFSFTWRISWWSYYLYKHSYTAYYI